MTESPVRIGLVGAGGIAKTHLGAYSHITDAVVTAICDPVVDAARTAAGPIGATAYDSIENMLEEESLDAVDICTPTAFHQPTALQAIDRGLHVLCEKPLAHNPAAARAIVEAAEFRDVLLMNGFCHRFHPPIAAVKGLIERGEMGEVVMFRNRFAGPAAGIEKKWFSQKAISGGGAFLDTSIHSIDLFRFLVGEVSRVQAAMRRTNPAVAEVEDTAMALLSTVDDRMGVVESCWSLQGGYNVVEVYGTRGAAIVHYWDGMKSRYKTTGMNDWAPLDETGPDRFTLEIQHFVDACLGRTALQVTGYDGLRAVEIAAEAYAAAGWD